MRKGKTESKPIVLTVRQADLVPQEIRLNPGFILKPSQHGVCWGMTAENPLSVTVIRGPGYYIAKEHSVLVAVGDGDFR